MQEKARKPEGPKGLLFLCVEPYALLLPKKNTIKSLLSQYNSSTKSVGKEQSMIDFS